MVIGDTLTPVMLPPEGSAVDDPRPRSAVREATPRPSVWPDLASRRPKGAAGDWLLGGSLAPGRAFRPGIMYNTGRPWIFLLGVKPSGILDQP